MPKSMGRHLDDLSQAVQRHFGLNKAMKDLKRFQANDPTARIPLLMLYSANLQNPRISFVGRVPGLCQ